MKLISFKSIALLVIIVGVASAFKTTSNKSLPITGWYEVKNNTVAPYSPASLSDPMINPFFDPIAFQPGAIDIAYLDCGSISEKVCAAYYNASDERNIQCPPAHGLVYFLPGGRP